MVWNQFSNSLKDLGNRLLQEMHWGNLQLWRNILEKHLRVVRMDSHITEADIENLKAVSLPSTLQQQASTNPFASDEEEAEASRLEECLNWYELLEKFQGSYTAVLRSGYLLNEVSDPYDPKTNLQFKGYQYVLDFDSSKFEVYEANALVKEYPLTNLPRDLTQPMVM